MLCCFEASLKAYLLHGGEKCSKYTLNCYGCSDKQEEEPVGMFLSKALLLNLFVSRILLRIQFSCSVRAG